MNDSTTICVCGAGTMGGGIAQVFAQHGFKTILFDVSENILGSAKHRITKHDPAAANGIIYTNHISECHAEVIIEAIVENLEAKAALFNNLSSINNAGSILATNTSSLSISALAKKIEHPERFAGMHFFNPAPVMQLVEVIKGHETSDNTVNLLMNLAHKVGKTPVLSNDSPGFIVNRVARPYYLEALHILEKTSALPETIDSLMEATGFRMGPFKLMDFIGNDINFAVSNIVYESLGKPIRLKPSAIQQQKVDDGFLGRKTGKGYYDYPDR